MLFLHPRELEQFEKRPRGKGNAILGAHERNLKLVMCLDRRGESIPDG